MSSCDVAIVFPPPTEARFFPYLSLPMITAYLRQQGVNTVQKDFNIELCHQLLKLETLQTYIAILKQQAEDDLNAALRVETAQFLLDQQDAISGVWHDKQQESLSKLYRSIEIKFANRGVEMLLEGSVLKLEVPSLDHISAIVERFGEIPPHDIAAKIQYRMLEDFLAAEQPRLFALSVAYYSQILSALLMAKWVKKLSPDTKVIFGGQQAMIFQQQLSQNPLVAKYVDCLGIGGGEETMLRLHQALIGEVPREDVPNLIWLDAGQPFRTEAVATLHIKDVPPPDFDGMPVQHYISEGFQMALTTCSGCFWGRCVFCSYGNRSRMERSYQQKTARQIADECQQIVERFGSKRINFVDENTNLKLVLHAMRILNERGVHITFSTRNRLEDSLLDKDFCHELRERGCVQMSSGYETYSQRLLDLMDKGVTSANYQQIIDNLYEMGIELRLSVMGGFPSETPEEAEETRAFLKRNEHKIGIDVIEMLVVEPNTYLSRQPHKFGIALEERALLRGNPEFNYGMGRLGYTYGYQQGADFDQRREWLMQVPETVVPGQNGSLPERPAEDAHIEAIQLFPWVKATRGRVDENSPEATFIMDLVTEEVFELSEEFHVRNGILYADKAGDPDVQSNLQEMIAVGLGEIAAVLGAVVEK
ncbi:MAG: radical SAM protein [Tumebacillaceae bacterium]